MAGQPVQVVEKVYFRPSEAAIVGGVSRAWIYARIADGTLKATRLAGRIVRIHRDDLFRFLEGNREGVAQ